jgi:hypothetical protein
MPTILHENFTVRIVPHPGLDGAFNIVFRDVDDNGVPTNLQDIFPFDEEQLEKVILEIRNKIAASKVKPATNAEIRKLREDQ